jgi:hypothetical protein
MGTRPSLQDIAPAAVDPRPAPVAVGVLPYYIKRKNRRPEAGTRGRFSVILLHHQPIKEPLFLLCFVVCFYRFKIFSFFLEFFS